MPSPNHFLLHGRRKDIVFDDRPPRSSFSRRRRTVVLHTTMAAAPLPRPRRPRDYSHAPARRTNRNTGRVAHTTRPSDHLHPTAWPRATSDRRRPGDCLRRRLRDHHHDDTEAIDGAPLALTYVEITTLEREDLMTVLAAFPEARAMVACAATFYKVQGTGDLVGRCVAREDLLAASQLRRDRPRARSMSAASRCGGGRHAGTKRATKSRSSASPARRCSTGGRTPTRTTRFRRARF